MSKKYSNPPIKEAVIEIRFNKAFSLTAGEVKNLKSMLDKKFPFNEEIQSIDINIGASKIEDQAISKSIKKGQKFLSEDKKYNICIMEKSFIFSRLTPYESWSKFIKQYKDIFDLIKKVFKKKRIRRIGLRYINEYNCLTSEVYEYIKTRAAFFTDHTSCAIDQLQQEFILSMQDHTKSRVYVGLVPIPKINKINIIFDIDVFENLDSAPEWKLILDKLNGYRKFKNDIFEANIGDKARRQFT